MQECKHNACLVVEQERPGVERPNSWTLPLYTLPSGSSAVPDSSPQNTMMSCRRSLAGCLLHSSISKPTIHKPDLGFCQTSSVNSDVAYCRFRSRNSVPGGPFDRQPQSVFSQLQAVASMNHLQPGWQPYCCWLYDQFTANLNISLYAIEVYFLLILSWYLKDITYTPPF